ncbi:hypothetical protein GJ496_010427 [Pomphorhynchus laevis]|nr:hypothetical protein GJ496_010427 [Pomphorhynchus laevis]
MWNQNIGPWHHQQSPPKLIYPNIYKDNFDNSRNPSNQMSSNVYIAVNDTNYPPFSKRRQHYNSSRSPIQQYSSNYNNNVVWPQYDSFNLNAIRNDLPIINQSRSMSSQPVDGYLSSHSGHDIYNQQQEERANVPVYSNEIYERFTGHLEDKPSLGQRKSHNHYRMNHSNYQQHLDQSQDNYPTDIPNIYHSQNNIIHSVNSASEFSKIQQHPDIQQYPSVLPTQYNSKNSSSRFQIKSIVGDGNCFFTAVADEFIRLLKSNEYRIDEISRHFSVANSEIFESRRTIAERIRKMCVQEWLNNEIYYKNFLLDTVNFADECAKFNEHGYYRSPLGDLAPLTVANIFKIRLLIISKNLSLSDLIIQPSLLKGSSEQCEDPLVEGNLCTINLYHNPTDEGHYDVALVKTSYVKNIPVHKS